MVDLSILKDEDIYSVILFTLYKLTNIQEYSVMSELPYILDKDNLFNFCGYFGGRTIIVPTIQQINSLMHVLLLYQYVKIDGMTYDSAIDKIGFNKAELKTVNKMYTEICDVLNNFNFGGKCE